MKGAESYQPVLLDTPATLAEGLALQTQRYVDAGYIDRGSSVEDQWTPISTYFGVRDASGELVAVSRTIPRSKLGLPSENDFTFLPGVQERIDRYPSRHVGEMSAMALSPGIDRPFTVIKLLFRAVLQQGLATDSGLLMFNALASPVDRMLRRILDLQFEPVAPEQLYRGALTRPSTLDLVGQVMHYRAVGSPLADFFSDGLSFDIGTVALIEPESSDEQIGSVPTI